MKGDARRINAIPTLLSKNAANYNLLIFLSRKYGLSDKLLPILKVMQKKKPQEKIAVMVDIVQDLGTRENKADKKCRRTEHEVVECR